MALHTRLDRMAVEALAADFGLALRSFRHLAGGVVNTSYVLETNDGPHVLTVLEKRDAESGAAYGRYLDALHRAGFPGPEPRASVAGGWTAEVRGKPVVLSRFIAGETNRRLREPELEWMGSVLARLHVEGPQCDLAPCLRITRADLAGVPSFPDREFAAWLLRRHEETRSVLDRGLPVAPTHGDLFPDNVITRADGRLVLIDWEDAAQDIALFDVGMAILGHCSADRVVPRRVNALLRGYGSVRPLDGDARDLVDSTVYVGLLAVHNRYIRGRATFRELAAIVDSIGDLLPRSRRSREGAAQPNELRQR